MKKMILGIAWQVMGFLGAIIILCFSAPHDWDYHGITGIIGAILGLDLIIPFFICLVLIVAGLVFCFQSLNENQ
ncbi:MAG: hypothetical protein NC416_11130 [Eubacterium sp.]|nr:hypothetical protein [Eubacterium sp.]